MALRIKDNIDLKELAVYKKSYNKLLAYYGITIGQYDMCDYGNEILDQARKELEDDND